MAVPHSGPIAGVIVIGLLLGGCGGNKPCRSSTVYKEGDNVPDIRIPDGMSQPDTSESLQIPVPSASAAVQGEDDYCLESPPKYFERPGAVAGSPEALIDRWAEAWNNKDAQQLFSFYTDDFQPTEGTLEEWRTARIRQLADPEAVRVSIESLSMSPAPGGQMQVQFVQRFESSSNSFAIRRELLMVRLDNNWFIAEERVTDVL